jgi:hypothetical protein
MKRLRFSEVAVEGCAVTPLSDEGEDNDGITNIVMRVMTENAFNILNRLLRELWIGMLMVCSSRMWNDP